MGIESLTQVQLRHFRDQGYLKLPQVFVKSFTEEIRNFIDEEAFKENKKGKLSGTVLKLYGLYDRNPALFQKVINNSLLVITLQGILGPNIIFVKNRHNHATVNNHIGIPPEGLHRDILQPTRGLITVAIYLEDSTVENGATRIIPGSHNLPYVGVPQLQGGGTWLNEHSEFLGMEEQALPVPAQEGDVLFFNGLTFHGVGENMTGQMRRSITLGFRSIDELEYSPDTNRQILVAGNYIYRGNDADSR